MDVYDSKTRSLVMRAVQSKNTKPEMAVRRLLHSLGYRYHLHSVDLPGKPDLVFTGRRKAIFVHGCFWHQHPGCKSSDRPAANSDYWRTKLDRNMARDRRVLNEIQELGWTALVVWECETRKANTDVLQALLRQFLGATRVGFQSTKNGVPRQIESENENNTKY